MKKIKISDLHDKKHTMYFPGLISIKEYECGYIIKPVRQEPILITHVMADCLAKCIWKSTYSPRLYTLKQANEELKIILTRELINKL